MIQLDVSVSYDIVLNTLVFQSILIIHYFNIKCSENLNVVPEIDCDTGSQTFAKTLLLKQITSSLHINISIVHY